MVFVDWVQGASLAPPWDVYGGGDQSTGDLAGGGGSNEEDPTSVLNLESPSANY